MLVVPGSARVRLEAEAEGLDKVFKDFGAEWRFAGCSMCLGMNPDQLEPGERCASTSNRNFEGRQGKGGRTHLVSPVVAAATAVRGTLSSPSDLDPAPESAAVQSTPRSCTAIQPDQPDPYSPKDPPWKSSPPTPESVSRCARATSTRTRSSPPCTSSASPAPALRTRSSPRGAKTRPSS